MKDLDSVKETFMSGEYVKFPLKNVILEWCHFVEPDTRFDKVGKFKCNAILGKKQAEDMEYIGFNIKTNADGQKYVVVKRSPVLGPPTVEDTDGNSVDGSSVGNGSVATIYGSAKYMTVSGNNYLPVYMDKVVIEDLVIYSGAGDSIDPF